MVIRPRMDCPTNPDRRSAASSSSVKFRSVSDVAILIRYAARSAVAAFDLFQCGMNLRKLKDQILNLLSDRTNRWPSVRRLIIVPVGDEVMLRNEDPKPLT